MNHATKMILVPHELASSSSKSADAILSGLDEEMKRIVLDQTLPIDAKMIQYNQVLQRFQRTFKEQNKPFQLEVKEPIPPPELQMSTPPPLPAQLEPTPAVSTSTHDELLSSILSIVPDRSKKNAELLLGYIRKNPNIKISDTNEIIVNNNKIEQSNIISLIRDLTRDNRAKGEPPVGTGLLLKALVGANVPRDLVTNIKRFDLLKESTLFASPHKSSGSESSSSSSPSKSASKKLGFNWNPFRQASVSNE